MTGELTPRPAAGCLPGMTKPIQPPRLPVLAGAPDSAPAAKAGKARGPTRGATLSRLQQVAQAAVGDATPLDAAFAAFDQFDGALPEADRDADAAAVRAAQEAVRRLLLPS